MTNCQQCGGVIPQTKRAGAVYCSVKCRTRAAYMRNVHNEINANADKSGLLKQLENEVKTARIIRALQPLTEQYKPIPKNPFLGGEFQII